VTRLLARFWRSISGAPRLSMAAVSVSDVGRVRQSNEDHSAIVDLSGGAAEACGLLVVADGMGGQAAGEVASELATTLIVARLTSAWGRCDADGRRRRLLADAIELANRAIHVYAAAREERTGMGTTVTVAAVHHDDVYVGHVGDSRAYLLRGGQALRLTKDHSLVQHLLDTGALTPEEAASSSQRNALLRALGPAPDVAVDLAYVRVRPGDALVLCSDGLWSAVTSAELVAAVTGAPEPRVACESLVRLANARGGGDNVTVLIARFGAPGVERTRPDVAAPVLSRIVGVLAAVATLAGCSSAAPRSARPPAVSGPVSSPTPAGIVSTALKYVGAPYARGGSSPAGFDCSGFVMFVYRRHGVALPHGAAPQYRLGSPVSREDLEPGDIVFFDGLRHSGIYIGGARFVHATKPGDVVKVSRIDEDWFRRRWVGARRVL
jgi:PPM family protein phosphatase